MAIAGSWRAGAVAPAEYAGATRWGTGINPVHAVRQAEPRGPAKEYMLPVGEDSYVPEDVVGPAQWGYSNEEAALYPGEDYRYMVTDHPNWGDVMPGRGDRETTADGPHPDGYPAWGAHGADDPDFPLPGYPGGADLRAEAHGAEVENLKAIAVPARGVSGGWLNKAHGAVNEARTSDPSQYEITTSMAQLHQTRTNTAAMARGTDDPRAPIASRLTGVKVKDYAKSYGMGGGPGTPDMAPVNQDRIPKRPWFFREGAVPPAEEHTWNSITYFDPIQRTLPQDAGEAVTTQEAATQDPTYGYGGGDYYA